MMSTRRGGPYSPSGPRTLPEWLRRTRSVVNATQEDIATGIDVSPQLVGRWERGETRVRRRHLVKLLRYFRTPRDQWASVLELPDRVPS